MKIGSRLRGRLSYANVAATLALFLALGGGAAIAAGKIGAKDLAPDSVGGSELKTDAAKGKHIKEDSLGPVPTAGKANNVLWAVVSNTAGEPERDGDPRRAGPDARLRGRRHRRGRLRPPG